MKKVTTNMFKNLHVAAWIGVRADCDITYCINTEDDLDFMLSDGERKFDFAIETEALRKLVQVGNRALAELDARRATETTKNQAAVRHERMEATA